MEDELYDNMLYVLESELISLLNISRNYNIIDNGIYGYIDHMTEKINSIKSRHLIKSDLTDDILSQKIKHFCERIISRLDIDIQIDIDDDHIINTYKTNINKFIYSLAKDNGLDVGI